MTPLSDEAIRYLREKSLTCSKDEYLSLHLPMIEANIPPKFRNIDYADITAPWAMQAVGEIQKYVAQIERMGIYSVQGKGLSFIGATGSGKTACACILLKQLILQAKRSGRRYSCYFIGFDELVEILREGVSNFSEGDVDFLVIDNFFDIQPQDFIESRVTALLRQRFESALPTMLTTFRNAVRRQSLKDLVADCTIPVNLGSNTYRKL